MTGYFKTIGDLERATYGMGSDNILKSEGITSGIVGEHFSATAGTNSDNGDDNRVFFSNSSISRASHNYVIFLF